LDPLGIETVESAVNTASDAVKGQTGDLGAEAQKAGADLKNAAQKTGLGLNSLVIV